MRDDSNQLRQRIEALEQEVAALKARGFPYRGLRKRSRRSLWGLPLYNTALGPDPATGEVRGHARGVVALGGLAVGVVLGIGGLSTGLLALGGLAIGGGAWGYYAVGGGALGEHVISGTTQDPEALRFFGAWLPGLRWLPPHL